MLLAYTLLYKNNNDVICLSINNCDTYKYQQIYVTSYSDGIYFMLKNIDTNGVEVFKLLDEKSNFCHRCD